MAIKIKNLTISGIRGIQSSLSIPLNEKSILLYGDNGSGKSSITDAIEWLYKEFFLRWQIILLQRLKTK
ncbi:MAG: AAA family ATPase [Endomicrobium sp.]|jgi:recombinational DNA repair ATPase RecF|nr:AAA family ATPase [Endomicrobium sp.]